MRMHYTNTPYEDLVEFQYELAVNGFDSTLSGGGRRVVESTAGKAWPQEHNNWVLDVPDLDNEDRFFEIDAASAKRHRRLDEPTSKR